MPTVMYHWPSLPPERKSLSTRRYCRRPFTSWMATVRSDSRNPEETSAHTTSAIVESPISCRLPGGELWHRNPEASRERHPLTSAVRRCSIHHLPNLLDFRGWDTPPPTGSRFGPEGQGPQPRAEGR